MAKPLALLVGLAACDGSPQSEAPADKQDEDRTVHEFSTAITAADLAAHTRTLSSDAFGGRPPSGPLAQKTIDYLTGQFERIGLAPGFDDGFLQSVPLVSITASPHAVLSIAAADETRRYSYGGEMMVWTTRVVERAAVENSELVFVGYGIVAPEYGWNDYDGIDMTGKTAVILVNDPGFATQDPDLFTGNAMTYYGRWTYKYEEAARQGAEGAIIVHETGPAGYPWAVVENSWTGPQFDLVREDGNMSRVAIEGWVQRHVAEEIFALAGSDYQSLKEAAARPGFAPMPLSLTATVAVENTLERSRTHNVAAVLEGAERPRETVVYTAHWDHLGTAEGEGEDVVYNGAVDNAAGVAAVLEIVERKAADPPPRRSVLFLFTGAEEQGLLGAYHYAENPSYPLAKTAAMMNIDVLLPIGETTDITVIGRGSSELEEILASVAAGQGRTLSSYPNPEQGFYFRSDHFAFAKKGVPALYLDTGTKHRSRSAAEIAKAKADYVRERYHKPSDEFSEDWDWTGAVLDTEALYEVGRRVADSTAWPEWYGGNPFKPVREESAAQRR